MVEITLQDVMETALTLLEENNCIHYTKKFSRENLIKGFSQTEVLPHWEYFEYSDNSGMSRMLSKLIIGKKSNEPWLSFFIRYVGYKQCPRCNKIKEIEEFYNKSSNSDGKYNICMDCSNEEGKDWRLKNPEKAKLSWKKSREKRLLKEPNYGRAASAKRRAAKLNRTPKWLTKEELLVIDMFYANCPEGYHVDHDWPLQGKTISGLHVISNLKYLSAHDNLVKSNKFDIDKENEKLLLTI